MMKKFIIAAVLLSFLFVYTSGSASSCRCKKYENNIYQFTITIPGSKPFYLSGIFLSHGMFYDTSNIANGQNAAELGSNLQFSVHSGYYECPSNNAVTVTSFGYVYKTNESNLLSTNGATAVLEYELQFLKNDNRQCTGTFGYALYTTGVNPFDSSNTAFFKSLNNSLTGELFNGRGFHID